jgi:hypothetical protein
MSTDKISRLQSLLDRIKKNAASPRRPLGSNLVFGGTQGARSDVSTGPSVPAASVTKPKETPALSDVASPRRPPLPPIAAAEVAVHQPAAPAVPRTPTLSGAARVPTMSGGPIAKPPAPQVSAKPPPQLEVIEELDFDDAVDITSDVPPPAEVSSVEVTHVVNVEAASEPSAQRSAGSDGDDLHWSEPPNEDRRPPDSSPRPRAAASLDEALAGVTAESVEPPIKTPPPESGRQPLEGVYAAPIPEPLQAPTLEQLGETLDLEAPTSAALELDIVTPKVQKPKEELEFELPPRTSVLEPPHREEMPTLTLEAGEPTSRHRAPEKSQTQILNAPDDGDTIEMAAITAPQEASAPSTDRDNLVLTPEITERTSPVQAAAPQFIHPVHKFAPKSFAELLDASLKLG